MKSASALVCLTLAACTVGSDYHGPASKIAVDPAATAGFIGADKGGLFDAAPNDGKTGDGRWWKLYDDPTLNRLVEDALAANTDLRVAAANIARADAALGVAEDGRLPKTSLDATFGYDRLSGEQYLLHETIPTMGIYDTGVGVSYQLDLAGQIKRGIEAAAADRDAARAAYDFARIAIVADSVRAYIAACSAGHELAVANRSLALQRQSLKLTERLVRAGRGSALDTTRSQAQVEQFRANIPALEAERRVALYRLATLAGKPPAAYARELESCKDEPALRQPIPVGDGAALIRRRPDIRAAARRPAAATARIGVATADLYPKVGFGLSAGSTGAIGDFLSGPTNRFGVGPLISWDFPQQDAIRARIKGAEAGADLALANFDGAVLTALRETESALIVYAKDLDRRTALTDARDRARQAEQQAKSLYRAGRTDALTELDAERVAVSADQALAAADVKIAADQITLFLALGGGWEKT
jgi:NodT family efflux transporter outer membrane factor (OMF) lipoprotein